MEDFISIRDSIFRIAEEIKRDRNDLYQKLLYICEKIDSLFSANDNYDWPMSRKNVQKYFGLTKSQIYNNKNRYLIKGKDYFIEGDRPFRTLYLERIGVIKIIMHSRSDKGIRYLKKIIWFIPIPKR